MPRAGTAARRREREGLPPTKPGPRSWVFGSKLKLFTAHKDEYLAESEQKTTGSFYKRGWDMPWNKDTPLDGTEGDTSDDDENGNAAPDSEDDGEGDNDDDDAPKVALNVAEAHAAYFRKLCGGARASRTRKGAGLALLLAPLLRGTRQAEGRNALGGLVASREPPEDDHGAKSGDARGVACRAAVFSRRGYRGVRERARDRDRGVSNRGVEQSACYP
ncbi:hypothetical protein C8F04DRAFT_1195180 [Mycena alexandri]|uniref:Uncharacterized protein n=1 Tax=Mycena alexandri TaxID=1745969 RepID=A0AAD6S5P9_9AGAR|nr:hypothetical protein C8F04DRAFT_1195180 [Mycena alexandri]